MPEQPTASAVPLRIVYLIGAPGAGKSTALTAALALLGLPEPEQHDKPIAHLRHGDRVWELGRRRETFSGTDALAMNVNPKAIEWVTTLEGPEVLVGEGDRLANGPFLAACASRNLTLVWLDAPDHVARQRSVDRAAELGVKAQSFGWWKGRATKVLNLSTHPATVRVDGDQARDRVAAELAAVIGG